MRRNRSSHCLFSMAMFVVILSMGAAARAQTQPAPSPTPSPAPTPSLEREFFKNILRDQKAIWTSPLRLRRGDSKWAAPFAIGTMALITTDRITGDEMAESDGPVQASRIISRAGSTYSLAAVAATFYLVGRKQHDERARETGLLSAEAFVDSVVVSSALKGISQRARPLAGIERSEFFDGGNSFPSGHSISAWSVATVIANEYSDRRLVQVAAYGAATAVSFSRFTGQKHYLSDVLVGSALGYGIGQYVYHTHHRTKAKSPDEDEQLKVSRWPAITPLYDRPARQYGVSLTWGF